MLKYSYKYRKGSTRENVGIGDFYASPDLSFISGTTDQSHALGVGDSLWISGNYFPRPIKVNVSESDTVKRNGYVTYPQVLEIKTIRHTDNENDILTYSNVGYVEYKGDIFFSQYGNESQYVFLIDDETYSADTTDKSLTISGKSYVEDNKVIVDGITYDVVLSSASTYVTFTDSVGNPYVNSDWDLSNITTDNEYVQKIVVRNAPDEIYEVKSMSRYGYRSYIIYRGEKMYCHYLYSSGGVIYGFGVTIDGTDYAGATFDEDDTGSINPYDKTIYGENLYADRVTMTINGFEYEIHFEPSVVDDGNVIGLELVSGNQPIILGDILTANTPEMVYTIQLMYDDDGTLFAYLNNRKYPVTRNICDNVIISGLPYRLTYEGNPEEPYVGMMATCTVRNGETVNFLVASVGNGRVSTVTEVEYVNGEWVGKYVRTNEGSDAAYEQAQAYVVESNDGVNVEGEICQVVTVSQINGSGDVYAIRTNRSISHQLRVVGTVGGNMVLCEIATYMNEYNASSYGLIITRELSSLLASKVTSVSKRSRAFGVAQLTAYEWVNKIQRYDTPVSVYGMSQIRENISVERIDGFFSLPVPLSRPFDNTMNSSNLIMSYLYDLEADRSIGRIVDMDKDMYMPVNLNGESISRMIFNLHFRTRNLETWEMLDDEGTFTNNGIEYEYSLNSPFTNWFITDYYPYNQQKTSLNDLMDRSDLLGFLYFTTNDVEEKRRKLTGSFLRLTFFDSTNPETQNMLGTSTIYMDSDRLFDTLYSYRDGSIIYSEVVKTLSPKRIDNAESKTDIFEINENQSPTVLTECYINNGTGSGTTADLYVAEELPRLDSRMIVDSEDDKKEGYCIYILKEFADRKRTQTIYMKAEFFHAGIGIKIPMVIATDSNMSAISDWRYNNVLDAFKKGYALDEVFDRLYIPIDISYDWDKKKYVYAISNIQSYNSAIDREKDADRGREVNEFVFNLFELKIQSP